ncbi:uncharacterized protein LOC121590885 [Anopheles merus]|uniref:uncharacterized protein LOC121590885 n=1 Tax=Anopheles merus TaxID=30066 RepID=UPI001BE49A3B|nr:uncharacterized protein LOC121590885 [Anopheles merus]
MENAKRPRFIVQMKNGKAVLLPINQASSTPPVEINSYHHLHPDVLEDLSSCSDKTQTYEEHNENFIQTPSTSRQHLQKNPLPKQKSCSTQTNRQPEGDYLWNEIINKLDLIQQEQRQQAEISNKRITALEGQIKLMRSEFNIVSDKLIPRPGFVAVSSFEWEPLANKNDLDTLEKRLSEPEFRKNFNDYLETRLPSDCSEERMHAAMDIIFTKELVTQITWTGISRPIEKICFFEYKNILGNLKT